MSKSNFNNKQLQMWEKEITKRFPHLSKPQAVVLAILSFGIVIAKSCSISAITLQIASLLGKKENSVRQRLREWSYDAKDKKGKKRKEIKIETCFFPLFAWLISLWNSTQIAIALDPTALSDTLTVLAICVLYKGCAIPIGWTILIGNEKHPWNEEWLKMLKILIPAIPSDWETLILADRGLYSPILFRGIVKLGCHPFFRVNKNGMFYSKDGRSNLFFTFAPKAGTYWVGEGIAYSKNSIKCTLLAYWEEGYTDSWFILTDLPANSADASWYALRYWIEHFFKRLKSGGWLWQNTHMKDPKRVERFWLAIAIATLWTLSVGGSIDETIPEISCPDISNIINAKRKRKRKTTKSRMVSIFRRGLIKINTDLLNHIHIYLECFYPEPWPTMSKNNTS